MKTTAQKMAKKIIVDGYHDFEDRLLANQQTPRFGGQGIMARRLMACTAVADPTYNEEDFIENIIALESLGHGRIGRSSLPAI